MKKTILKYGLYSFLVASLLFLSVFYIGEELPFQVRSILGFVAMLVPLCFVYFGIKQYKNDELHGEIDFKTAFIVGALISIFAAVGFGITDAIYISEINPDFSAEYLAYENELLAARTNLTQEEMTYERLSLLKRSEAFQNPMTIFFVMTMMVFVLGVIVSLLSSFILYKKN